MRYLADGTNTERNATEHLLVIEGRLALAQEVARLGYWDWDTATDTVECSDELYRVFGLTLPADGGAEYTAFQDVHPDDLLSVQEAIRIGLETHQPYEVEHRVVHPNGASARSSRAAWRATAPTVSPRVCLGSATT